MALDPGLFLLRAPAARPSSPAGQPPWMRRKLIAVPVILAVNAIVYLAWEMARKDESLFTVMRDNFIVSTSSLIEGHPWTLITSAFSHEWMPHLAVNMIVLYSFGGVLERLWGLRVFATFYMVAAVVSSASHCAVSTVLLGRSDIGALGASGAVCGLLFAYTFLFPRHKILLFFVIPVPALAGALLFVAFDIWGLIAQTAGGGLRIGHGAHLGGAACGVLFYFTYLRQRVRSADSAGSTSGPVVELTEAEAAELNRLRAKVESEGPQALTPEEQVFLGTIRQRFKDQSDS